jgi:hypothetical protein
MKTTAPFYVNGMLLCTICTEGAYPHLVSKRAADEWGKLTSQERQRSERRSRHGYDVLKATLG